MNIFTRVITAILEKIDFELFKDYHETRFMKLTLAATGIMGFTEDGEPIIHKDWIDPVMQIRLRENAAFRADILAHLEGEFGEDYAQKAIEFAFGQEIKDEQYWRNYLNGTAD